MKAVVSFDVKASQISVRSFRWSDGSATEMLLMMLMMMMMMMMMVMADWA